MTNIINTNAQCEFTRYKIYINQMCVKGSCYYEDIKEFEEQLINEKEVVSVDDFLIFLTDKGKLNQEYCSHFESYINSLYNTKIINHIDYSKYYFMLDFYLAKSKYNYEEIQKNPLIGFESNNFIKENDNPSRSIKQHILKVLKEKGIAIYLNNKGKICIRFSIDDDFKVYSISQANIVLKNFTKLNIEITKDDVPDELPKDKDWIHYICINDLLFIHEIVFDTTQDKEFFEKNGLWYRNKFKPSKYMQLNKKPMKIPLFIFYLIAHLVNYDIKRFFIFMNWLACFLQTLKKSQTSILFKGQQGAGKGTLFKIIEMIFNPTYCKQINGDSLKSNYLGAFIEDTLFLNFDEINHKTIGKGSFSSFLKAIITNDVVTSEKKGINMDRPTKVHAQTILFSNVDTPVEIEQSDRRFTVFTTAGNIKETDFFGLGNFESLEKTIFDEIEDFTMYLKLLKVDIKQANSVFETFEKELMINRTENNLQNLVNALLSNNLHYFEVLRNTNVVLYNIFMKQIVKYRVFQKHLILIYNALYPQDKHIESAKTLIKHLEKIAPHIFGDHNLYKTNGDKYYSLIIEDIVEPFLTPSQKQKD